MAFQETPPENSESARRASDPESDPESDTGSPMGWRPPANRLWWVPVVLCVMAVAQRLQVEMRQLHPWKGGGFGMFAAPPPYRVSTLRPTDDNGVRYQCGTPREVARSANSVGLQPSEERCRDFARELLRTSWSLVGAEGNRFPRATRDAPADAPPIGLRSMEVEISEYRYHPPTHSMKLHPVTRVEVSKNSAAN